MHETIFAKQIIDVAKSQGEVEAITLEIGELAHVPTGELIACLKGLVPWNIEHTEIPAKVSCRCGFYGHPVILERGHDSFLIECPDCGAVPRLVDGTDIKIVSVKVK